MKRLGPFSRPLENAFRRHRPTTGLFSPTLTVSLGSGRRFRGVLSALREDPAVSEVTLAEETDDEVLYRFGWDETFRELTNEMVDHHAAISEAKARDGQWNLTLRFAEEDMISDFQEYFRETGRRFEVDRLEHLSEPHQREFGLTKEQYEALVLAVRHGYFQILRATDVEKLGGELDIPATAVTAITPWFRGPRSERTGRRRRYREQQFRRP